MDGHGRFGRRPLLLGLGASAGLALTAPLRARAKAPADPRDGTLSDAPLSFPRDHGSHPSARVEWWYVTGVLRAPGEAVGVAPTFGFQLTFFRLRHPLTRPNDGAFAPSQLLLAHAALSDLRGRRLLHDDRLLRQGFANARADEADTRVRLGDWSLERREDARGLSRYTLAMRSESAGFALRLALAAPLPPLLQGQGGWSRKGPGAQQASRYVSEPQLAGEGRLALRGADAKATVREQPVAARAWLDHEWSNQYLGRGANEPGPAQPAGAPEGVGWDWLGINLDDGSSLTLFQMRDAQGAAFWTGGSWRDAQGRQEDFQQRLRFEPLAHWQSPLSLARYPTRWRITTPRGVFVIDAAYPEQEMDGRRSTGILYWEGVARVSDANGERVLGWGYLEMTGYAGRVPL